MQPREKCIVCRKRKGKEICSDKCENIRNEWLSTPEHIGLYQFYVRRTKKP